MFGTVLAQLLHLTTAFAGDAHIGAGVLSLGPIPVYYGELELGKSGFGLHAEIFANNGVEIFGRSHYRGGLLDFSFAENKKTRRRFFISYGKATRHLDGHLVESYLDLVRIGLERKTHNKMSIRPYLIGARIKDEKYPEHNGGWAFLPGVSFGIQLR